MKKLLILFMLSLCAMLTPAQAQDVVYLRNGSVIKGTIVEHIPNQMVRIETSEGNVHEFTIDEVERMVFTPQVTPYQAVSSSISPNSGDYLKKGFRAFVEFAADIQTDAETPDYYNGFISLPLTVGYQANKFFFVGAGIAPGITSNGRNRYYYDYYDDYYYDYRDDYYYHGRHALDSHFVMPIYGAVRFDFVNARVSPFLDLRAGYSVTDYSRGAYASAAVGCRIYHFNISIGYTFQDRKDYDKFNHVALRLGYGF